MSGFNAKEVQGRLEAILAGSHRQVAARCALYCAEVVEAAREDERRLARERSSAAQSQLRDLQSPRTISPRYRADTESAWTRGFFGDSFAKSVEARGYVQQPTLDRCHADRTNDRDCVWILKTAFQIRNKVINERQLKESTYPKEIEEDLPSTSSLKHAKTNLDPKLVERIVFFRDMVQRAVGLWQERLLDDTPCLTRSATTDCEDRLSKALPALPRHSWDGRTESPVAHHHSVTEGAEEVDPPTKKSPYRHLISSASGKRLEPPNGKSSGPEKPERTLDSPVSATPKSRKEVQEDLGRELAQLAEDLRNAQIISSH